MPTKANLPTTITTTSPDRTAVQGYVNRRLALRFSVSLPVAATIAALAGLGPKEAR